MRRRRPVEYRSWGTASRAETVWSAGSTDSRTWTSLRCSAAASPRMTRRSVSTSDSNSSSFGNTWNNEVSVLSS